MFDVSTFEWLVGIGAVVGVGGIGVIVRHPVYFRKHYAKLIERVLAELRRQRKEQQDAADERRRQVKAARPSGSDGDPAEVADEIEYAQESGFEELDGRIADCAKRIPSTCETIRGFGWGLIVLAPMIPGAGTVVMLSPPAWGGWPYVSVILPTGVAFYILREFREYVRVTRRTEQEYASIPSDQHLDW